MFPVTVLLYHDVFNVPCVLSACNHCLHLQVGGCVMACACTSEEEAEYTTRFLFDEQDFLELLSQVLRAVAVTQRETGPL